VKRLLALALTLCLLGLWPALAEEMPPALYTGRLSKSTQLLSQPNGDTLGNLSQRQAIEILTVDPDWLQVRVNGQTGYIRRRQVDDSTVIPLETSITPRYPAMPASYLGWVESEAAVRESPNQNAMALITLQEGARMAFIGFEDGWAKLVYHRQYGYVDTRLLGELQPLFADVESADGSAPIAAYTSFYKIDTDNVNLSRMVNIRVACQRFAPLLIQPQGRFDFNAQIGPYNRRSGYEPAYVLVGGKTILGYGGGTCQVSSTLYNTLMQLPGLEILARRPHGPVGASYLPLHADAAVGNLSLNLVFRNNYRFPVRIDGTAQDGALTIAIYRADTDPAP